MTTTANAMLENCCSPCCGDGGCKNKWTINIESTNPHCLRVDTSECWVVKLEPSCPKPTYVGAWVNVTIKEVFPPDECYIDGGECWIKWWREISATDEKVKACPSDTTPGTLIDKLEEWKWITITTNWCDGNTDSTLVISVDENDIDVEYPEIEIEWSSNLINFGIGWGDWHTIYISDKAKETYDNMCCIGFLADQNFHNVTIDSWWNADTPFFMWENGKSWTIYTGNHKMAKADWIKILADWYYRLFWQLTVQNNIDSDFYFNLWRWLLRIIWERPALDAENGWMYLSTAKHWAYGRQILLNAWSWIDVTNQWEIKSGNWDWQTDAWFNWPWMTFNIDTLVDLRKWDRITLGYRPQSNNISNATGSFRFVWQNDSSTWYHALFGGTLLWVYQLAPKCFQEWEWNEVYWTI